MRRRQTGGRARGGRMVSAKKNKHLWGDAESTVLPRPDTWSPSHVTATNKTYMLRRLSVAEK